MLLILPIVFRVTDRPPPYSEVEHIAIADQSFALFLANVDPSKKVGREPNTNSGENSTAPLRPMTADTEGEKPCQKLACRKVMTDINTAFKRNRDERVDLAFEQEEIDFENRGLEETISGLEEDVVKIESEVQSLEKSKTDSETKVKTNTERREFLRYLSLCGHSFQ